MQEQIGHFHEARLFGELVDRVAAMEQDADVAVDIGDARLAAGSRGEARIVSEDVRLAIQLADVHNLGPDAAGQHGLVVSLVADRESGFVGPVRLRHAIAPVSPAAPAGPDFHPARATPAHQKSRGTSPDP